MTEGIHYSKDFESAVLGICLLEKEAFGRIHGTLTNEIFSGEAKQDWYSMDQLMFDLIVHQEDIKAGKKELISSGFKGIDRLNGGFTPGQLIVLGARPSVGKSAIMNKISFAVAAKGK